MEKELNIDSTLEGRVALLLYLGYYVQEFEGELYYSLLDIDIEESYADHLALESLDTDYTVFNYLEDTIDFTLVDDLTDESGRGRSGEEFNFDGREYYVISENNIDDEAYERAEQLIEDCYITKELKSSFLYQFIDFDEACKAVVNDGYGHLFSSYDGNENDVVVNDTRYYIFRTN